MKRILSVLIGASAAFLWAGHADAYTSKLVSAPISVSASGVAESTTFTTQIVQQNTPDTPGTLSFGSGGNTFRNSNAAIKLNVSTNVADNRVIIYTSNLSATASPKFCEDTAKGIDGGGLVGVTDCKQTVPLIWAIGLTGVTATSTAHVSTGTSANVAYAFTPTASGVGATNGVFVTDKAHVASFTTNTTLDNAVMKKCSDGTPVTNTPGDGKYPQFFGSPGVDSDLCDQQAPTVKNVLSQELSKNIAVVAFGCSANTCNLPNLAATSSDIVQATGPFYLPVGADFRLAPAQNYSTNTLTVELVTQ